MVANRAVARAMATQLDRVNNDPEALKERIRQLEADIVLLKQRLENQRRLLAEERRIPGDEPDVQKVLQVNGRPIGTQADLARAMHTGQYNVSRWHRDHRLQVYTDAAGIEWFFLDQGKPPRKPSGQ